MIYDTEIFESKIKGFAHAYTANKDLKQLCGSGENYRAKPAAESV